MQNWNTQKRHDKQKGNRTYFTLYTDVNLFSPAPLKNQLLSRESSSVFSEIKTQRHMHERDL